ncbi:MAG: phosphoglycerate kinase [bacterium]|nr:MAG: phosphoglycerate kinase [bacterium]
MRKKTLRDIEIAGRKILMRVDFNVPLTKDGDIADDTRIRAALESIDFAAKKGASVILMSHLGRPKGAVDPALSLKVVAYRLGELISHPVRFIEACIGEEVEKKAASLAPGEVLLLENVRFYEGETKNDQVFARQLARLGDCFSNDAFGTAHRAHASTEGVAHLFDDRVAGFLMERELEVLEGLLAEPERPFVAVLGGAKVSGKIGLVKNLLDRVDRIVIGGGMAYTFFKAVGLEVGRSLVDEEYIPLCRELMEKAGSGKERQIFLPVDCIVASEADNDVPHKTVSTGDIPEDWIGVDIGEKTIEVFKEELVRARTVFWNGPMGIFEMPNYAGGTRKIAKVIADITEEGVMTVVGGGDSVAALNQLHLADKVTHVSTGGGASLELLEGKKLPGVEVLNDSG